MKGSPGWLAVAKMLAFASRRLLLSAANTRKKYSPPNKYARKMSVPGNMCKFISVASVGG